MKSVNEKVFCLLEGEPAIYEKISKNYYLPKYSYEEVINLISKFISQTNSETRLSMRDIWPKVATIFGCEKFSPHFSKKKIPNYDSFESRFSRDVTKILDTSFKRGFNEKELSILRKSKIEKAKQKKLEEYLLRKKNK